MSWSGGLHESHGKATTRVKGAVLVCPLVIGSIAFPLGKKATEGKTHKWVCYIRGLINEDISYYIKKVVFTLHNSFANPKRVIEKFPFEVHEVGWGEFEIAIKIFFVDTSERSIDLFHPLRLHPFEGQTQIIEKKKRKQLYVNNMKR